MKLSVSKFVYLYSLILLSLFLYSFTQIDLGLALTRFPAIFSIQRSFQEIGYFNRPLSTYLYSGILVFLFGSYAYILFAVKKKILHRRTIWMLVFFTTGILTLSYNAFSHDIFNYIFDAKIFTFYGKNPYAFKALDFPGDPMLGFMHWTHRVYPYGPVWLAFSIPLSYLGMQVFVLTFFLFKLIVGASYLGSAYFLEKTAKKIFPGQELLSLAFFAFNPLIIIESLVSGHHDIVMMFLAISSLYFLIQKRYVYAVLLFVLSVGIKYATIFLFPIFSSVMVLLVMKIKVPWVSFLTGGVVCLLLAVLAASQQSGNFQPWYLLFVLPFAALLAHKFYILIPGFIISIMGTLVYIPFLYVGNWDKPVQTILFWIYCGALVLCVLVPLAVFLRQKVNSVYV